MSEIMRPVWADPTYLAELTEVKRTNVNVPSLGTVKAADNNPRRWAIGFAGYLAGSPPAQTTIVSGTLQDARGWVLGDAGVWFRLFDHGPLVAEEWYIVSGGTAVVTVYEIMVR